MALTIRWFPPSWIQIKTGGKILYVDPAYLSTYYKKYPKKIEYAKWPDPIDGLPEKDMETADIILVTHHHKDHCKNVTVKRLSNSSTVLIAPQCCGKELRQNVKFIKAGDEMVFGNIAIKAVPAYNTPEGNSTKKQHKENMGVGYLISTENIRLYHAGDTDLIPEMKNLGRITAAFLPIGGTFTMDIPEAIEAVKILRPEAVIPIHYKGAELDEFMAKAKSIKNTKAIVLKIGEEYRI